MPTKKSEISLQKKTDTGKRPKTSKEYNLKYAIEKVYHMDKGVLAKFKHICYKQGRSYSETMDWLMTKHVRKHEKLIQ